MVAESSEFHLAMSRAHRVHFFKLEIPRKKRDILSEKRESRMVLKKSEFTPESGSVDTFEMDRKRVKEGGRMQCFMKKEDKSLIDVENVETTGEMCCHLS